MDTSQFDTHDSIVYLWNGLGLPPLSKNDVLHLADLPGVDSLAIPSSFKIGHLAQATIALSALTSALVHKTQHGHDETALPRVTVPLQRALLEFNSEKYYSIDGVGMEADAGPHQIGGLHKTSDGFVRVHDGFPNHREGAKQLLGLAGSPDDRSAISAALAGWKAVDFETACQETGLAVAAALRSSDQWNRLPQAAAVREFPISIRQINHASDTLTSSPGCPSGSPSRKCLQGLRVVEMTRVVAGPVAGRTLAAHGADVIWVTGPHLPDLPAIDRDFARGKRTVQLDIEHSPTDKETLLRLLSQADVFIQSYRPGSLAAKGLDAETLAEEAARRSSDGRRRGLVVANLSAYGPTGPWHSRRGFDSLVQTCTGMNVSEAEHFGAGTDAARPMPCQALDHASGYLLASGICAALWRRAKASPGSFWRVDVSLAGTMKYLSSLGQYEGASGFACEPLPDRQSAALDDSFELRESGFGPLRALKHSATVEGFETGWTVMPKSLGSDEPVWI